VWVLWSSRSSLENADQLQQVLASRSTPLLLLRRQSGWIVLKFHLLNRLKVRSSHYVSPTTELLHSN
jgi:hypothetical protein